MLNRAMMTNDGGWTQWMQEVDNLPTINLKSFALPSSTVNLENPLGHYRAAKHNENSPSLDWL